MKLQGLDPESGLWILCKKLEERNGRIKVKWDGYLNSTAWLNKSNIRQPITKRPLRSQPSRADWPLCKHPSFVQRSDKICIRRDDGSRSAEMVVHINDPFQCNMITTCKQTLRYELLVEGTSMSDQSDTPTMNNHLESVPSADSHVDEAPPTANPNGTSRQQEKTPNAKNKQISSENQSTRKRPACDSDISTDGQKKRRQSKQATKALRKFRNEDKGRRLPVEANVQEAVIETEFAGRNHSIMQSGAPHTRPRSNASPETLTIKETIPRREVVDNVGCSQDMSAMPTSVTPLPLQQMNEMPLPSPLSPQLSEPIHTMQQSFYKQGTAPPTLPEEAERRSQTRQFIAVCKTLVALKKDAAWIKKVMDEICKKLSLLERQFIDQSNRTPGLAEATCSSVQSAKETREKSSVVTEELKRELAWHKDPKVIARRLAKLYFTDEERATSNCNGIQKKALDPMKLALLRRDLFLIVPTPREEQLFIWKTVTKALDAEARSKAAYQRKKSKQIL